MSSESLLSEHEHGEIEQPSVGVLRRNRRMEARAEHQTLKTYTTVYSLATSIGIGTIILVLFWILHYRGGLAWHSDPDHQFYWHPLLMVIGLVFMYSQAILIFRTGRQQTKPKLKLVHAGLHAITFILTVIALVAVFDYHNLSKPAKPNMYTLHSWIGLGTVIVYALQFVGGFISFLYPGLPTDLRKIVMKFHVPIGIAAFISAIAAAVTGLGEKAIWTLGASYGSLPSEAVLFNLLAVFTVIYGILVLYLVNEASFRRSTAPDGEIILSNTEH